MVETAEARTKVYKAARPKWRKWVKYILLGLLCAAVIYHGIILINVFRLKKANPQVTSLMEQRANQAAREGRPVQRIQTWVSFDQISPNLVRAVLAGEDSRFFDHAGFDWEEIQKALEEDWNSGEFKRGASTITQQLAKNLFLSTSKNPLRKLHEALITKEIEWVMGKRRILELYLNVIEWGDGIYGAEAAARNYFNTPAATLTPDQAAFLSAIIPSPNGVFNPKTNARRVERRRNLIARLMRHVVIPKELN